MPTCSAYGCSYKRKKIPGRTVHKFPFSRPDILKKWIINIRRANWMPGYYSILCSSHFEEDCFDRSGQCTRLKPDAVPTKFNFPSPLRKVVKKRKLPRNQLETLPQSSTPASNEVTIQLDPTFFSSPGKVECPLKEIEMECEQIEKKVVKKRKLPTKRKLPSNQLETLPQSCTVSNEETIQLDPTFFSSPRKVECPLKEIEMECEQMEKKVVKKTKLTSNQLETLPQSSSSASNQVTIQLDPTYFSSPGKIECALKEIEMECEQMEKKLEVKEQSVRTLKQRIKSLRDIKKTLEEMEKVE